MATSGDLWRSDQRAARNHQLMNRPVRYRIWCIETYCVFTQTLRSPNSSSKCRACNLKTGSGYDSSAATAANQLLLLTIQTYFNNRRPNLLTARPTNISGKTLCRERNFLYLCVMMSAHPGASWDAGKHGRPGIQCPGIQGCAGQTARKPHWSSGYCSPQKHL